MYVSWLNLHDFPPNSKQEIWMLCNTNWRLQQFLAGGTWDFHYINKCISSDSVQIEHTYRLIQNEEANLKENCFMNFRTIDFFTQYVYTT